MTLAGFDFNEEDMRMARRVAWLLIHWPKQGEAQSTWKTRDEKMRDAARADKLREKRVSLSLYRVLWEEQTKSAGFDIDGTAID